MTAILCTLAVAFELVDGIRWRVGVPTELAVWTAVIAAAWGFR